MNLATLIDILKDKYQGLIQLDTWGETSLFYNPEGLLKRGAYCFTFKEKDGENDAASMLNRANVGFRMNFKVNKPTFLKQFDEPVMPKRPPKGGIISLASGNDYNPTLQDCLFPHPVYAWMSWVSIIDPSQKSIEALLKAGFLDEAYEDATARYAKAVSC